MPTGANPPRFILSYARRERDSFLDKFFSDLRRELAFKEGLNNDPKDPEPGFRDTDAIPGGADWSNDLAAALAHSLACVSLYTPNYFQREACGKEFQVFLDRAGVSYDQHGVAQGSKGILPVLWASMEDLARKKLPPSVAQQINFRSTKHQQRYERDGLRHILQRSPKAVYLDILDDIVRDLIAGFQDAPKPLPNPPRFADVKDAFAGTPPQGHEPPAGPTNLTLFLIGDATSGAFSATGAKVWVDEVQDYDANLGITVEQIDPDPAAATTLVKTLGQHSARNALVIALVDPRTARDRRDDVLAVLQTCIASPYWTGAILLPPPSTGVAPLSSQLQMALENADRIHLTTSTGDETTLTAEVRALTLEVLKRVASDAIVQRHAPGGGKPTDRPKVRGPVEPAASS